MQYLHKKARSLAVAALTIATGLATVPSHAGLFDETLFGPSDEKRLEQWTKSPEKKLTWGDVDFVRLVARNGGSPNAQPVSLDVKQVAAALATIQARPFRDVKELFSEDEIKKLSPAIVAALKIAGPDQDLAFVISGQHAWTGLVAPVLTNTGRIFFADGKLNIIIGLLQADVVGNKLYGSRQDPKFDLGSRTAPAKDVKIIGVTEGQAQLVREDWIALTLAPSAAPAVAGAAVAAPAAGAAATAKPATAAEPGTDAFYAKQESRLKALQRLKDQGLITETEFQAKRAQIVKDL
ncbi:hypothetical protein GCM10025771_36450 [Niveibacterium umoris]|uniref:SHOCT domain-containing protein n=1 Tax=Niveibacterium umoris TaxID=1193620 RepID=A0A840BKW4_9RHOO|nr:SHOCT domain-containing protein [Niveibacterium umoris]MBB4011157.1 hypothetical protein [Niveibacterium umoris]